MQKLVCKRVLFYGKSDEDSFFQWINKIACIKSYQGIGDELHLYVNPAGLSLEDYLSLRGLFKRYKIGEEQLKPLKNMLNKESPYH